MRPAHAPSLHRRRARLRLALRLPWLPGWPAPALGPAGWQTRRGSFVLARTHVAEAFAAVRRVADAPEADRAGFDDDDHARLAALAALGPVWQAAVHEARPLPTAVWHLLGVSAPAAPLLDVLSWLRLLDPSWSKATAHVLEQSAFFATVRDVPRALAILAATGDSWPAQGGDRVWALLSAPERLAWAWSPRAEVAGEMEVARRQPVPMPRLIPEPFDGMDLIDRALRATEPAAALTLLDRALPEVAVIEEGQQWWAAFALAGRDRGRAVPTSDWKGYTTKPLHRWLDQEPDAQRALLTLLDAPGAPDFATVGAVWAYSVDPVELRALASVLRRAPQLGGSLGTRALLQIAANCAVEGPDPARLLPEIMKYEHPWWLVRMAQAAPKGADPVQVAVALAAHREVVEEAVTYAWRSPADVPLIKALSELDLSSHEWTVLQRVLPVAEAVSALADGQLRRAVAAARLDVPMPETPPALEPDPRLPPALGAALARLRAWPGGDKAADKLLAPHLPAPEALEREIAHLEAIAGEAAPLRLRLDALRARRNAPLRLSPAREAHLVADAQRSGRQVRLGVWEAAARAQVRAALVGFSELPPELFRPEYAQVVSTLPRLRGGTRRLAGTLLAARVGEPPWDLRDHPENRRWMSNMVELGLDLEPWLAREPEDIELDGASLRLGLESDPLEIFRMGEHFGSCLSPGGVNFFSVFTNAADLNKAVLYARRPDGVVAARVLLAITQSGGLLAFHRYAHDDAATIDTVFVDWLHRLAARMRTVVVATGEVPTLVGDRWYDDGPHDLTRSFPALDPEGPLWETLRALPPDRLVPVVTEALAPLPLNALTVGLLLNLAPLLARPELVSELAPWLGRMDARSPGWIEAVDCIGEVDPATARRLSLRAAKGARRAILYGDGARQLAFLSRWQPKLVVRMAPRWSRCSGCSDWREDGFVAAAAARAAERLGLRFRAHRLWRAALDANHHELTAGRVEAERGVERTALKRD